MSAGSGREQTGSPLASEGARRLKPQSGTEDASGRPDDGVRGRGPIATVSIDTEPDDAWSDHRNESLRNVGELLRLQQLLDEFGAKATLLVTYGVIDDGPARDVVARLVDAGGAEVGAHLHPWENPPFMDSRLDTQFPTYPHELPLGVYEEKLACLTDAIARHFGRPTCYRGGRWGIVPEHLPVLERLGYQIDTSVMPWVDWRPVPGAPSALGGRGGVDQRLAPQGPYHPAYTGVSRPGDARILEIPVTVGFTRRTPRIIRSGYGLLPVFAQRMLRRSGLLRPVWATPAEERAEHLMRMLAVVLEEGARTINIALHSSELMVGGSPSTGTSAATDEVFRRLRAILEMLANRWQCRFGTLTEAGVGAIAETAREPVAGMGRSAACRAERAQGTTPCTVSAGATRCGNKVPAIEPQFGGRGLDRQRGAPARLVYILAASHSGSTLLAMLLGAHSEICTVGELNTIGLRRQEGYRCSCGELLVECPFWRELHATMGRRGFERMGTDLRSIPSRHVLRLISPLHRGPSMEKARDAILALSPTWRRAYPQLAACNVALVDALCELTGKQMVVDSSKIALRLKYLLRTPGLDVRVIRLVRDGRAVSLTYMNPYEFSESADPARRCGGRGLDYHGSMMTAAQAALLWRRSNEDAEALLATLPESQRIDVRYEDLCAEPAQTLRRIFRLLRVDPNRGTLEFRTRPHHVIGNGMRFDSSSEIRLDERWRTVLTTAELRSFDRVAGRMNCRYGYQ